jgi:hypothetical protein
MFDRLARGNGPRRLLDMCQPLLTGGRRYRPGSQISGLLSRRQAVLGALSVCGCAGMARAAGAQPPADPGTLRAPPAVALTAAEQERHGIFLLAAMALLCDAWGVDQSLPAQRAAYAEIAAQRRFAAYLGHNIGALLVDREGGIVCFALNRNVALNSTMAHACKERMVFYRSRGIAFR